MAASILPIDLLTQAGAAKLNTMTINIAVSPIHGSDFIESCIFFVLITFEFVPAPLLIFS